MVYTKVELIFGVKLDKKEIFADEALSDYFEESDENGNIDQTSDFPEVLTLYKPVCHSGTPNIFFIGKTLHTAYHKVYATCQDCLSGSKCSRCIGKTNEGFFDVEKIHREGCIVVNPSFICSNCDAFLQEENCQVCGVHRPEKPWPMIRSIEPNIIKEINRFSKGLENLISFYLVIDDCLSCR
jgi:hypothetical protein